MCASDFATMVLCALTSVNQQTRVTRHDHARSDYSALDNCQNVIATVLFMCDCSYYVLVYSLWSISKSKNAIVALNNQSWGSGYLGGRRDKGSFVVLRTSRPGVSWSVKSYDRNGFVSSPEMSTLSVAVCGVLQLVPV